MDAIYGFIDAGHIAHGPKLRTDIKNVFPADVASSLWEKPVLLQEQATKWTK